MIEKELLLNLKTLESLSNDELKVALDVEHWAFKNEYDAFLERKDRSGLANALMGITEWNIKKAFDYAKGLDSLSKFRVGDLVQFNPHTCNSESVRRCIGAIKYIDKDRKVLGILLLNYGDSNPILIEAYGYEVKLCGKEIFTLDPDKQTSLTSKTLSPDHSI